MEFGDIVKAEEDERSQALEDRRFYSIASAQWEGSLGQQFENRPKLELNKIHLSVIRIFNEYRNNRISVNFVDKSDDVDEALADTCDGLLRADEQDSGAEEAYDNGFEEGVGGGMGAWRLRAEYEDEYDEDNDKQRIRIEPIYDADKTVFFDLGAKKQDKSDAKKCFVITPMTPKEYEEKYGENASEWPDFDFSWNGFDWYEPDTVRVAEVYIVEETKRRVEFWQDVAGNEQKYTEDEFEQDPALKARLEAVGSEMVRVKRVKSRRVHKYIMSGSRVLSDEGYIAGKCIPIVPFYGKRWFVDGIERFMGHVRLAKDAQRLLNMQMSKLAELSASSMNQKPIFTSEQIAGHEQIWADDAIENYPYLTVNSIVDPVSGQSVPAGPVGSTVPPAVPPAMAALLQLVGEDLSDILGSQENGDEIVSNISSDAVQMVQSRLDMQTFIYMSNMAKAKKRTGEIWLSMASDLFVEPGRKMKSVNSSGENEIVSLMSDPEMDPETGDITYKNDLSRAQFDVSSDVGPSSSSRRGAAVRALTQMIGMTSDPEAQQVLSMMALMNMEGEGVKDARVYARKKLIALGAVKPTQQEIEEIQQVQAEQQPQQPDPNAMLLMAEAQKSAAEAQKVQNDAALTDAKIGETRADTIAKLAAVERQDRAQAMDAAEKLMPVAPATRPTALPVQNG